MLNAGEKIAVYDSKKVELGEGTFLKQTFHPELKMIAYECQEHTILAKGPHYVKVKGKMLLIMPDFG